MKLETLKDLYIHELKDLYSAEKQIIKALPKMVRAATDEQLAAGFEEHLEQTKEHAARLEKILTSHDESTRGPKCEGMEGLLKEGDEMIKEHAEDEVRDAGLIAAAQRVEHYEMAGYGCARTYAELLEDRNGVQLLQTTDPSFVITHNRPLEEGPELYRTFRDKEDGCIKVVLTP
jgi:ferritin-like metal-binding protein YciE